MKGARLTPCPVKHAGSGVESLECPLAFQPATFSSRIAKTARKGSGYVASSNTVMFGRAIR